MAHWAELDENSIVIRVTVGSNDEPDEGYGWLVENLGGRWVQTSYNATIRKHFAGVGYTYDDTLDAFIPPKCHDEAVLEGDLCIWICDNVEHEVNDGSID